MKTHTLRRRVRRWLRVSAGVVLVAGMILLGVGWLVLQHVPSWYQPARLDAAGRQNAQADATRMADWIGDKMVQKEPFEVLLHDWSVTDWLAVLPSVWPEATRSIPEGVKDVALKFDTGQVLIGAHCARNGWRAIISLTVTARLTDDGGHIEVVLRGVHGGSLPLPKTLLAGWLEPVLRDWRGGDSHDDPLAGVRIRNRFIWPNGDRPFRIASIKVGGGDLRVGIVPL
jgi:hypothetical protein